MNKIPCTRQITIIFRREKKTDIARLDPNLPPLATQGPLALHPRPVSSDNPGGEGTRLISKYNGVTCQDVLLMGIQRQRHR